MYEKDPMSDTRDTDVFRWLLLAAIIVVVGGVGLYVGSFDSPDADR
jgi:hypothetical protein